MAKPDLNKLKAEIESRKQGKNMTPSTLGESVGSGVSPRDVFLNGLLKSRNTGEETASTNLIKVVENKVAAKKGEVSKLQINETAVIPQQQRQHIPLPTTETVDMSPERDEMLFRDLESKRKQTLAESIQGYVNTPAIGAPMRNQPPQQPMNLNEQYLTENVTKIVKNYLVENLSPIFEEAIKDTMLEMYAASRIKSVLQENKDIVKAVVVEVIREIQAKAKQNKAQ